MHAEWLRHGWRFRAKLVPAVPRPPPLRDNRTGRFRARHVDRYLGVEPLRGLIGGPFNTPYYLSPGNNPAEHLLPCMFRAKALKCGPTPAWDPLAADVRLGIRDLLDVIGDVLCRGARLERCIRDDQTASTSNMDATHVLAGSEAFAKPLTAGDTCMWVDPAMARAHAAMSLTTKKGAYLHVAIGVEPSGGIRIYERAHRIVAWAMLGPPPPDLKAPVAMHTCGDTTCLNPLHLVWGGRAQNATPRFAHLHAHNRLEKQRRPIPAKLAQRLVELGILV